MRVPDEADLTKERAVLLAILLDVSVFIPYTITVWKVGSLSMMAELLRGGLLLLVESFALLALRAAHRGRTYFYEFGIGKLEQMLAALIGVLLIVAAAFVIAKVMDSTEHAPLPAFWAAAAMVLVVYNLASNSIPLLPLWRASRGGASIIVAAQFRSRLAKSAASVIVVVCVALDLFAPSRAVEMVADDIGGLVGAGFMLVVGARMIADSLPDLLDRALAEPLQIKVNAALAAFYDQYEQLLSVRTRKSGSAPHVEITIGFDPARSMADVAAVTARLKTALKASIPEADVVVIAAAYPDPATCASDDAGSPTAA